LLLLLVDSRATAIRPPPRAAKHSPHEGENCRSGISHPKFRRRRSRQQNEPPTLNTRNQRPKHPSGLRAAEAVRRLAKRVTSRTAIAEFELRLLARRRPSGARVGGRGRPFYEPAARPVASFSQIGGSGRPLRHKAARNSTDPLRLVIGHRDPLADFLGPRCGNSLWRSDTEVSL
jgi:hypothetical protein